MTAKDILIINDILSNMYFTDNNNQLSVKVQAKIFLLKVYYNKIVNVINKQIESIIVDSKPSDYDDFINKNKDNVLTEDEIENLNIKKSEYETIVSDNVQKFLNQDINIDIKKLNETDFIEIYSFIGIDGEMSYNNGKEISNIPKINYLTLVASNLIYNI